MDTNPNNPTPAHVGVTKAIELILATAGKNKVELARLIGKKPSAITYRCERGTWTIDEMELICAQVGAPITVLFDPDALGQFLADRSRVTADQGKRSTKWYMRARQPALAGA